MTADPHHPGRRDLLLGVGAGLALAAGARTFASSPEKRMSTLLIRNARITTLDPRCPQADALAVVDGRIVAVGTEAQVRAGLDVGTVIDAGGRRVVPG